MQRSLSLFIPLTALLIHFVSVAQNQIKALPPTSADSSKTITRDSASHITTIITKVPFRGTNYFIKIVPIDTADIDQMPSYNPERDQILIRRDTLQHLFRDWLLKRPPGRRR